MSGRASQGSKAGHQLRFGTRHPEQLAPLASELGASAGTPEEAVAFAEAVLLAVPLKAVPDLARSARFSGKVILDAANAYSQRDGKLAQDALAHAGGSSAWVAEKLAGARVVKAFNSVNSRTLASEAHRKGDRSPSHSRATTQTRCASPSNWCATPDSSLWWWAR